MLLTPGRISFVAISFLMLTACRSAKKETTNSGKPDSPTVLSPIADVARDSVLQPPVAASLTKPSKTRNVAQNSPSPLNVCLLYTSDAADEEDSVDLGGRR